MTIRLPSDLADSIEAAVHRGRFASVDEAVAAAVRILLRELARENRQSGPAAESSDSRPDPILGLMRDDAALMDEIVADAYRLRREETWRKLTI
jgi:Arc/MetJ-type ribon-helix-helix transcriptional regulator